MQGGRTGAAKAERALELFRKLTDANRKLFVMMGWEIFYEAGKEAIIKEEFIKKIAEVIIN